VSVADQSDSNPHAAGSTAVVDLALSRRLYWWRILSLLCAALALIPIGAFWMGPLRTSNLFGEDYPFFQQVYQYWEQGWLWISIALISTFILTLRACREPKVYWLPRTALFFLISALTFNLFWLQFQREWLHGISAILVIVALVALIGSALQGAPPPQKAPSIEGVRVMKEDAVLSLYTFYEGRVQTIKSILVGILTGILSLQIPLFIQKIIDDKEIYTSLINPIFLLFAASIPMFISLQLHMLENDAKSKIYQYRLDQINDEKNRLVRCVYNPELPDTIYKIRRNFPFRLEWFLLIFILLLGIRSFYKF
jgi:hypothetical protein